MVAKQTKSRRAPTRQLKPDPVQRARAAAATTSPTTIATEFAEVARIEFDPVPELAAWAPPSAADLAETATTLRFAAALVGKTKAEIFAMFAAGPDETLALAESLESTRDWLGGLRDLAEAAFNRMLVAGAAQSQVGDRAA